MKFAHLADCHLGSWKHPELQQLNLETFKVALDRCIEEKVDFVIIAGDLFDTAIPSIDILKEATAKLKELKDAGIGCFIVPGSHDFSISGKSMIHVLEKAGLCHDVTVSVETKDYFIQGIGGEKKGLEIKKVKNLKNLKKKDKLKILVLHTTLKEMNFPMESVSIDDLPEGFDYYALGHIHIKRIFEKKNSKVVYPGALFPCNFSELEQFHNGSFFIVNYTNTRGMELKEIPLKIKEVIVFDIDAEGKTLQALKGEILEKTNEKINNKIVTLRISGTLDSGKPSEIDFQKINKEFMDAGAYCILRNTSKLTSKEFELAEKELKNIDMASMDIFNLEKEIIKEMITRELIIKEEKEKVLKLMEYFDTEKAEGETNESFASRLSEEIIKKLDLDFIKNVD